MIRENEVIRLANDESEIMHMATGSKYVFVSPAKGKTGGSWMPGAIYRSYRDGALYWRSVKDFSGFKVCE